MDLKCNKSITKSLFQQPRTVIKHFLYLCPISRSLPGMTQLSSRGSLVGCSMGVEYSKCSGGLLPGLNADEDMLSMLLKNLLCRRADNIRRNHQKVVKMLLKNYTSDDKSLLRLLPRAFLTHSLLVVHFYFVILFCFNSCTFIMSSAFGGI